jgi:uncharacterized protein YndB with AHSA1/START domain
VYRALLDQKAVATWMVPDGMTSQVHEFDGHEGGCFRISLTYDQSSGTGKSSAHTDTFHGRFTHLIPDEEVVETVEFESDDPALQGEMTMTFILNDAPGGTDVHAEHDGLPPGLSPDQNAIGWQMSLSKLAALVESQTGNKLGGQGV